MKNLATCDTSTAGITLVPYAGLGWVVNGVEKSGSPDIVSVNIKGFLCLCQVRNAPYYMSYPT